MCIYNVVLALHIDTTTLSDGTYELISESDGGDPEVQVNAAELMKPRTKAVLASDYQEGKPRSMSYLL